MNFRCPSRLAFFVQNPGGDNYWNEEIFQLVYYGRFESSWSELVSIEERRWYLKALVKAKKEEVDAIKEQTTKAH